MGKIAMKYALEELAEELGVSKEFLNKCTQDAIAKCDQIREIANECPLCRTKMLTDGEVMWCSSQECDYGLFKEVKFLCS